MFRAISRAALFLLSAGEAELNQSHGTCWLHHLLGAGYQKKDQQCSSEAVVGWLLSVVPYQAQADQRPQEAASSHQSRNLLPAHTWLWLLTAGHINIDNVCVWWHTDMVGAGTTAPVKGTMPLEHQPTRSGLLGGSGPDVSAGGLG
jgi:hypothetical protein